MRRSAPAPFPPATAEDARRVAALIARSPLMPERIAKAKPGEALGIVARAVGARS